MAAMPVVWCSDPNSSNKKPTAFALQGIQLQGNISEQHVLAVRELINAASQGQLLLPANGGIVLLDCGVGVGSVIIQDSQEQDANKENNERSKAVNEIVQLRLHKTDAQRRSSEILYEFLCCARCTNEGAKCCNRNNSSKIVAKFLDAKLSTGRGNRRPGSAARPINSRRKNTVSFKSEKRPLRRIVNCNKMPVYATVNKQQKQKNRGKKQPSQIDQPEPIVEASTVNRKTSFDSTCTVSSMDSGFMDMQAKLGKCQVQIKIDASEETDMVDSTETLPSSWSRLNIPSQSRNRRKSYEEFKLLFCDKEKPPPVRVDAKSSIKSRRKSYEEFKSVTSILCDNNSNSNSNTIVVKNDLTAAAVDENSSGFFKMKRKNSRRISARKVSVASSKFNVNKTVDELPQNSTIYDILKKNSADNVNVNEAKVNYDKNLELFKSHCSKNNIKDFDNLMSCGTIYDIIQRKTDLYTKNFKRLDKYMTYGTLYEILHRKTDEDEQFERKRTLSEKFSNKRINYAHIDFKSPAEDQNNKIVTVASAADMGEENLNSTSTATSASSMKQGSGTANNQLSITSLGSQQLSTIYDILQTKKLESPAGRRNRFLVRKITEEDLIDAQKENEVVKVVEKVETSEVVEAPKLSEQKKQNRIRRFSNILSYTPKADNSLKVPTDAEKKTNVHLEAKIDELYSRLNRITQQNDARIESEKEKEPSKIFKSNSLDMLSTLNENEALITRQKPLRKISVPTHQPMKALPKKSTRRLSEFTRGEFLNEKS
jgi:hypothetical protein